MNTILSLRLNSEHTMFDQTGIAKISAMRHLTPITIEYRLSCGKDEFMVTTIRNMLVVRDRCFPC